MGKRTEHAPGTFSWVDLTTRDGEAAKAFYGGLFGWDFEDNEIPGGGVYSMCKVDGDNVAAISPTTMDHPQHWNNYVTVASADDAAAKAKDLGAELIEEPFDVMEAGRMGLFRDPTGAMLCIWEPGDAIGAQRVNDPGCLTWNELRTSDVPKAMDFYSGLFGWSSQEMDTGEGNPPYSVIKNGERVNGGVSPAAQGEPSHWIPYFVVENREESASKAEELGGKAWVSVDMEQGKIAVLSDPQGAPFAIWEGDTDD